MRENGVPNDAVAEVWRIHQVLRLIEFGDMTYEGAARELGMTARDVADLRFRGRSLYAAVKKEA